MYNKNPFGNPDGAQADIENLKEGFIDIAPPSVAVGVNSNEFTSFRIIVGDKGSGKTHYLRMLRESIKTKSSNSIYMDSYIDDIKNINNATSEVIRFCNYYPKNILSENWEKLWKCAIFSTVISHLLNTMVFKDLLSNADILKINEFAKRLNVSVEFKLSIYDYLKDFLYYYDTGNKMDLFLNNIVWDGLEVYLLEHLRGFKTMYFFLDSIDEQYEHAPQYWFRCQKGLFYAVMHLLREEVFREKLHIVICIRSNVYASILRSEHQLKYNGESHILLLNWTRSNLEYFIKKKIEKLKNCYFIIEDSEKSLYTWLTVDRIDNLVRNINEDFFDYIIRHTRLVPRDVIQILNSLAEIRALFIEDTDINIQDEIRKRIGICAKAIGDELLTICAKQILINEMPVDRNLYKYADFYTSGKELCDSRFIAIQDILSNYGKDEFLDDDLTTINKLVDERLGNSVSIIDILWLNKAMGYISDDAKGSIEIFYNQANNNLNARIPRGKKEYVLCSCLSDALELKHIRPQPIYGFNRNR